MKQDPGTSFTLTALRRMVKRGELPAVEVASKRLINFDALLEHLAAPPAYRTETPQLAAAGAPARRA